MEEALLCAPPAFLSSVACLNEWAARAPAPAQRLILALCTGSASVSPPQLPPGTDAALVATVDKCTQCLLFVRRAVLTAAAAGGLTPEAVKAALDAHTDLLPDINSLIAQAMASALVAPEGSSAPPAPPMPPALPALTGVEWTYGITTHSTGMSPLMEPFADLQFAFVQPDGSTQEQVARCTLPQVQALLASCRAALNALEKA